jgi:hypothetical protein
MLTINHLKKVYEEVKIEMEGYIINLITEGNISGTSPTPAGSDLFTDNESLLSPLRVWLVYSTTTILPCRYARFSTCLNST